MKKILYTALLSVFMVVPSHAESFTPLYATGNLVPDPELTNLSYFPNSWGSAAITTASGEVYAGVSSGKIASSASGSITFATHWKPNTTYLLRAMVKTNGTFQLGTGNTYIDNGSASTDFEVPNTNNQWVLFERQFTTGSNAGAGESWFNNYQKVGTIGYIDNWEVYEDVGCFSPLYPSGNLVPDPELTDKSAFATSWGTSVITTSSDEVYCGTSSGKVQSGDWGSLTFAMNWTPNTTYVMRAMVKTNGTFQIGVGKTFVNNGTTDTDFEIPNTNNEWVVFEQRFTTGSSATAGECWFNNAWKSGTVGYIDNWELYEEAGCYRPLYPSGNLVPDPELTSMNNYPGSWGTTSITTASSEVYCGSSSGKIQSSGSIAFAMNWKPNTNYVLRARVQTSGTFQFGVGNTYINNASSSTDFPVYDTNGGWVFVERAFTTGANASAGECWFNNYGKDGTLGYIDNWELYEEANLQASVSHLTFDHSAWQKSFVVTATQLSGLITIDAPAGLTVQPSSFAATSQSQVVTVTHDGTTEVEGEIVLHNWSKEVILPVKSVNSEGCFVPTILLYDNLIADPELSDASQFKTTGTGGIIDILTDEGIPYCGATCGKFGNGTTTCSGSIEAAQIAWKPNTVYRIVAMVRAEKTFTLGVNNVDGNGTERNFLITGTGAWNKVDYSFKTGANATTGGCYFHNCDGSTSRVGYVDNWEIYEIPDDLCE